MSRSSTTFKQGQCGNPGGKPRNARNRLQLGFLNALADDFEANGVKAIQRARVEDPVGYVKAIAALMPKQFEQTSPIEEFTDAELVAALDTLSAFIASGVASGTETAH